MTNEKNWVNNCTVDTVVVWRELVFLKRVNFSLKFINTNALQM